MSDEETDDDEPNTFIKRSPSWRSDKLSALFHTLDQCYACSQPEGTEKVGAVIDRSQPRGLPLWACLCLTEYLSTVSAVAVSLRKGEIYSTLIAVVDSTVYHPVLHDTS